LTLNVVLGGAVTITGVAMIQFLKPGAGKPNRKPPASI
jgi:hypothetical protein